MLNRAFGAHNVLTPLSPLLPPIQTAPKALFNFSLGRRPRIPIPAGTKHWKCDSTGGRSVPNEALIEINAVLSQQLAVFLLKRADAMMLLLLLDVFQHGLELTRTYRKRPITALPKKSTISSIACLDPFRRRFLYAFDKLRLADRSGQRRHDMNMIRNTADMHEFGSEAAANGREIRMHSRPHVEVEPGLAVLRAEDDVKNDFAEGLCHGENNWF